MSHYLNTEFGGLFLKASPRGLTEIRWVLESPQVDEAQQVEDSLVEAERKIRDYLLGHQRQLTLRSELHGTDFQKRVWSEVERIPYGETVSYTELAQRLGCPKAVRAVGRALGANPLVLLIPCHRVVGREGGLGGYSGGIETKLRLLDLETKKCAFNIARR